ncbi:hypothetical protein CL3_05760 [butyrate-producing bacterium SM4/1]|nr:hypothetical protein CLS_24540 [[Clostridium] cf. saccharolyticum K10]CBL35705.1 hypothetical protein CL3_05760 [butyrate-producing bacterium SM4/1]
MTEKERLIRDEQL